MPVTYVSQSFNDSVAFENAAPAFDTSLLQAARSVYANYCQAHTEPLQPAGVAVGRDSHRGQLIFNGKPVLLPDEYFVPFDQLDFSEDEVAEPLEVEPK